MIEALVQEVQRQEEQIGQLKDEIAVLKGEKKRPRFKPSKLDEKAGEEDPKGDDSKPTKRPGSEKRAKTAELNIHEERTIAPARPSCAAIHRCEPKIPCSRAGR